MFHTFSHWLLWVFSLLGLSSIFLILINTEETDTVHLNYDELLQVRMNSVGIPTWKALQEKSGLGRTTLRQVRSGKLMQLQLSQLNQLATALNWNIEELLQNFGIEGIRSSNEQPDDPAVIPLTNANASNQPEIEELRQECLRLREQLQQQNVELTTEFKESTFKQIQTLLTNYPSLRPMVQVKPELPAKNIISLLTPLDNLLSTWGYELIGQAWEQVEYNPQLHQPDNSDIQPGELIYVRFVGYRQGERILVPAKVSRTLPGGAS